MHPHLGNVLRGLLIHPGEDGLRVREHGAVRQLQRGQLLLTCGGLELVARSLPQERNRVAVGGDHLLVLDVLLVHRLLHAAARMHLRAALVAVADVERWGLGHVSSRLVTDWSGISAPTNIRTARRTARA